MIEYLSGKVLARLPHSLIIDVNGVGYGVEMPLSSLCDSPPPGQNTSVWIDTYVREDAIRLFGFQSFDDRQAFLILRSVSGIGPKIALAVMSTLDARSLRQTILQGKISMLESIPGIGKRTAERLILELKPKMEKLSFANPTSSKEISNSSRTDRVGAQITDIDGLDQASDELESVIQDVRSALENLGYKDKDINPIMSNVLKTNTAHEERGFQPLLKSALKSLRAGL